MTKKRKLITFDWAIKRLLRSKANFGILEGFLSGKKGVRPLFKYTYLHHLLFSALTILNGVGWFFYAKAQLIQSCPGCGSTNGSCCLNDAFAQPPGTEGLVFGNTH